LSGLKVGQEEYAQKVLTPLAQRKEKERIKSQDLGSWGTKE